MSHDVIRRNVEAAMDGRDDDVDEAFAEKYPHLLLMASTVDGPEARDRVRQNLEMMLQRMTAVESGNAQEEQATIEVLEAVLDPSSVPPPVQCCLDATLSQLYRATTVATFVELVRATMPPFVRRTQAVYVKLVLPDRYSRVDADPVVLREQGDDPVRSVLLCERTHGGGGRRGDVHVHVRILLDPTVRVIPDPSDVVPSDLSYRTTIPLSSSLLRDDVVVKVQGHPSTETPTAVLRGGATVAVLPGYGLPFLPDLVRGDLYVFADVRSMRFRPRHRWLARRLLARLEALSDEGGVPWEPDQVGADAEACAGAHAGPDGGCEQVQHCESGRGDQGQHQDLLRDQVPVGDEVVTLGGRSGYQSVGSRRGGSAENANENTSYFFEGENYEDGEEEEEPSSENEEEEEPSSENEEEEEPSSENEEEEEPSDESSGDDNKKYGGDGESEMSSTMSTASLIANGCNFTMLQSMFTTEDGAGEDAQKENVAYYLKRIADTLDALLRLKTSKK
ncbi:hypothetical protein CEUSTIGMA_g11917.t1 [Chlamydomonas eustigma]|uniref:Uncharacterized protein n=1 Tax=Chlamydomonas eustigma TaxID=1157962 RepID=A0A250XN49_9CHLO|nr:hypothetical protein CEUSTIGMA_g11917.t1 [Chlamydomonas eustigma]|eukprot:GAX84497.1 hypothetical protein CEUSTIGMA_g11917.t1 [Chlamydomonas eustigma]